MRRKLAGDRRLAQAQLEALRAKRALLNAAVHEHEQLIEELSNALEQKPTLQLMSDTSDRRRNCRHDILRAA